MTATTWLSDPAQTVLNRAPVQQNRGVQQRLAGGAIFLYQQVFQPTTLGASWAVFGDDPADPVAESVTTPESLVKEQLEFIEAAFDLRVSRVADLLGVTRQALYDWKKGRNISDDNRRRLDELHRAARRFREAGLELDYTTKHTTIGGELEFIEALERGHDPVGTVETLIGVLERGRKQRERLERLLKDRPEPQGSIVDDLPPHYPGE